MIDKTEYILITGVGGFVGSALAERYLHEGFKVVGIDNLNSYYNKNLKIDRLNNINRKVPNKNKWAFINLNLEDNKNLKNIFEKYKPQIVINLAAQAGVRYSIENPSVYFNSNLYGFFNVLENCKEYSVKHLIYASSSSIYGANRNYPFHEEHKTDSQISFYAATKKCNEIMANSYSHLYKIPSTGLRFFTVYGPWGRPDMAPFIFSKNILLKKPIKVFNNGNMSRDFTYIDDVVNGTFLCSLKSPQLNKNDKFAPHKIFNIGYGKPTKLLKFIELLENEYQQKAIKVFEDIPPGDVEITFANTENLEDWVDYKPQISIEEGVKKFAKWFREYHKL